MLNRQDAGLDELVIGLFWDTFAAADVIRDLIAIGFEDSQIGLLGILGRAAPNLRPFLSSIGLPSEFAAYCNAECEDGALLLSIHMRPSQLRSDAVQILRNHGAVFPAENWCEESVSHEPE